MNRILKKIMNRDVLCRLPGIVPLVLLGYILLDLAFHRSYQYPSFDPSCLNTKCLLMLLGLLLIFVFGIAVSVSIFRGNFKYSMTAALFLCVSFVPFGFLGIYLSDHLRENAFRSYTSDIANYGDWDDEVYQSDVYEILPDKSLTANGELEYLLDRTKRYGLKPGSVELTVYLDDSQFDKELSRLQQLDFHDKWLQKSMEENEIRFYYEDAVVYVVEASISYDEECGRISYSLFYGSSYWEDGIIY